MNKKCIWVLCVMAVLIITMEYFIKPNSEEDVPMASDVVSSVSNQISKSDFVAYKNSGKMFRFSKPYLLRAQNSRNRSGYGWEWDWSTPYQILRS